MFDPDAVFELSERTTLEFDSGTERTGRQLAVEEWNGPLERDGYRGYEVTTADGTAFVPMDTIERINLLGLSNQAGTELRRTASEYRREGTFVEAGDAYTRLAFHTWATYDVLWGLGCRQLLEAATCYRLAGQTDICKKRCQVGVQQAETIRDRTCDRSEPDYPPDHANRGGWDEFVGTFRLLGELDGVDEAYAVAKESYFEAGDPRIEYADEGPVHQNTVWFDSVAREIGRERSHDIEKYTTSYSEWADYKRERLPEYVAELVEQGEWWTGHSSVLPEY